MAEVADVDIVDGVPTTGTGTVPTLSRTNTSLGLTNETAPATDIATSGLNGRLQRVAQRITSLIALVPTSLTSSGYFKVAQRDGAGVAATFTCGTTAYAASDVVGAASSNGALTFTSLRPDGAGEFMITSATLEIDTTALISGETSYNLELYNVTPPSAINDSSAWDIASGDRASHLGTISLGVPVDKGSTLKVDTDGIMKQITMASANVFGYLVSVGAYTPTARVFVITLHGYPL